MNFVAPHDVYLVTVSYLSLEHGWVRKYLLSKYWYVHTNYQINKWVYVRGWTR